MPLLSLSQQKTMKKLSEPLSKGFERLVYWNEYKKSENKNTTNE